MTVVEASEPLAGEPLHWREAIIDMSGPGALYSPFGETINLVLTFKPNTSITNVDPSMQNGSNWYRYYSAIRIAGLKAAAYLARVTRNMQPDKVDFYELKPVDSSLPKVAVAHRPHRCRFYGESTDSLLATLLHPNEFMDGAFVNDFSSPASSREFTYCALNNSILSELYQRHSKDLNFVGIMLYGGERTQQADQDRVANYAANLIEAIGVQGILLTGMSEAYYGAMVMFVCQKLEKKGIKTTIISTEMLANPGDRGFTHYVPEAVAMISTGNWEDKIALPAMKKVIGGTRILKTDVDAGSRLDVPSRYICGATDRLASGRLTCEDY
jgi:glycine reductase